MYKEYTKENKQIEKNPKKKRASKYPYAGMYQKRELMGLSEEQIIANLEKGYLIGAHYSVCNKVIANKMKLEGQESATETMFNKKRLLFNYNNYSTAKDIHCSFCMYYQYFIDISINNKNNKNEGARRLSRRK